MDRDSTWLDAVLNERVLVVGRDDVAKAFREAGYSVVMHVGDVDEVYRRMLMKWRRYGRPAVVVISGVQEDGRLDELVRTLRDEQDIPVVLPAEAGGGEEGVGEGSPLSLVMSAERLLAEKWMLGTIQQERWYQQKMFVNVLRMMAKVIEVRDPYTRHHSEDVARYARALAKRLGWSEAEVRRIGIAGLLHDIGKIGVPERLLIKPSPLTPEETRVFQQHPLIAVRILEPIENLKDIIEIIRHHHERYDGNGYPDGLKGPEVSEGARIIQIVDAYDCMRTSRPYRRLPMEREEALEELENNAGTQFDPHLVEVFVEMERNDPVYLPWRKGVD